MNDKMQSMFIKNHNLLIEDIQLKTLNVPTILLFILRKCLLHDYDYTFDFIESLKKIKGFYEFFELMIIRSQNISISENTPKIKKFGHKLIKLYYNTFIIIASQLNIFNFDICFGKLLTIYNLLKHIIKYKVYNSIEYECYCILQKILYEQIFKYYNLEPLVYNLELPTYDIDILTLELKNIIILYNKEEYNKANEMIDKFKKEYPNTYPKKIYYYELLIKFMTDNTKENADNILNYLHSYNSLHPLLELYKDITIFDIKNMINNIIRRKKIQMNFYENHYFPNNKLIIDHIKHIIYVSFNINNKLKYTNYISNLYLQKSPQIKGVITDYLLLNNTNKNYTNIVNFYDNHFNYLQYLFMKNTTTYLAIINIVECILIALCNENRLNTVKELECIIKKINISTEILNKYNSKIESIIKIINTKQNIILNKGFIINYENNIDDICMICFNEIYENITTVFCNHCKKNIGHLCCMYAWLIKSNTCPNCRYTPK